MGEKKTLQEQGLLCIVYSFTAGTSVLGQKSNEDALFVPYSMFPYWC